MPFIAETTFHVRYAETDAQRIIHHSSYINYFEEGRSNYIRQRGHSYAALEREGHFLSVIELNIRYLRPAVYDDRVTVRAWVSEVRSRGLTFSYQIVREATGEELVTGSTKHLCVDGSGKVLRLPETWTKWVD